MKKMIFEILKQLGLFLLAQVPILIVFVLLNLIFGVISDFFINVLSMLGLFSFYYVYSKWKKLPLTFLKYNKEIKIKKRVKEVIVMFGIDELVIIILSLTLGKLVNLNSNLEITDYDFISLIANLFAIGLLGPVVEEFIFRGVILKRLGDNSYLRSILVVSIVFGIIHFNLLASLSAFTISIMTCFVCVYTKDIWTGVALHVLVNIFNVLCSYLNAWSINEYFTDVILILSIIYSGYYLWRNHSAIKSQLHALFNLNESDEQTPYSVS